MRRESRGGWGGVESVGGEWDQEAFYTCKTSMNTFYI